MFSYPFKNKLLILNRREIYYDSSLFDRFSLPGNPRGKLLVAVKVLHKDATESAK